MKSKTNRTSKNTTESAIERVKLDLLSLVSHELRTPLTSVLNSLRVLKDGDLGVADRQKFLDMALRNADRLNVVLNQLLDLSKLVSGRLVCRFHEVSLRALMLAQLEALRADAELLGFELKEVGLGKALDELPVVLGDAPRLEQVIKSIFENALKFAPSGAKVTVRLEATTEAASLGIPALKPVVEENPKAEFVVLEVCNPIKEPSKFRGKDVFEIFSQQEDILDRKHEGVGGSLAIAFEVMQQHGGALHANVAEECFTIQLALPVLKNEQALLKVLESRMYALRTELGAISLMVLNVSTKSLKHVLEAVKAALFRASDTVYSIPDRGQIVVLMDDCKKADAPKIVRRLIENLGVETAKTLKAAKVGLATFPDDATSPEGLLSEARSNARPISEF